MLDRHADASKSEVVRTQKGTPDPNRLDPSNLDSVELVELWVGVLDQNDLPKFTLAQTPLPSNTRIIVPTNSARYGDMLYSLIMNEATYSHSIVAGGFVLIS